MNYIAYTDGSYQDSIGAGGYGSVILDDSGKVIKIVLQIIVISPMSYNSMMQN